MEFRILVFLTFLFLFVIYKNKACLESERSALVEFKQYLNSEGYDGDYLLPSWHDDPKSECCEWQRVKCDSTTGHVTELSFGDIRNINEGHGLIGEHTWNFNFSMLRHFDQLRILNLTNNQLVYYKHDKGSESVSRLKRLEILDLSINYLDERIIPALKGLSSLRNLNLFQNEFFQFSLKDLLSFEHLETLNLRGCWLSEFVGEEGFEHSSKLSKLKHLDISGNEITENVFPSLRKLYSLEYLDFSDNEYSGPFPIHEMSGLSNLTVLLMGGNQINGSLSIQNRTVFPKLQVLDLNQNTLESVSLEFGALTSLKVLDLSNNGLNDSAIPELCRLKMLEELDLVYANISVIPRCLHNLTSLKVLDLSNNAIKGQVPSSWMASLTSLVYINLRNNYFQGMFSFSTFNNHSQLETVLLGSYDESFEVETEDEDWMPKFQLKILMLSKCKLNLISHRTPKFLSQQRELRLVDLSENNLQGRFPDWLLANNSGMIMFDLSNNFFTGDFNLSVYPMKSLISIDVSENQIKGTFPANLGNIFPKLAQLQLSRNGFSGSLPSSVGLMRNLMVLDLSSNNFSGQVPETLFQCTNLEVLKLSNNEFTGNFFSTHYNFSQLIILQLNDNKFMGSMSNAEMNSKDLRVFDISFNFISGKVPTWINRTVLDILNLRHNSLTGEVSCEVFAPEFYVDLSQNSLSGTIPSCSNMEYVKEVHLQSNNFTGSIPEALLNSSFILALNLRDNRLSGTIPDMIGNLSSLQALLLGSNQLTGLIPKQLCLLNGIRIMDLSRNYLSGSVPLCLANISFGRTYDQCIYSECGFNESYGVSGNPFEDAYLEKNKVMDDIIGISEDGRVFAQIDFTTKHSDYTYKGDILSFMSGLDLSCNNLAGKIPATLGNLSQLHSLNLSHNHFTGSIPTSFANLTQIESLDLSHNMLSGEIPSQLTDLTFLGVFSVAYNNLSGMIPYGKAQFGTFERSSYEGNAYLCGKPLEKNCSGDYESGLSSMPLLPDNGYEHWYEIDEVMFFASFSASFAVFFSGVIVFLYVNPYRRQCVFYYGEMFVLSCCHFGRDVVFMLSLRFRRGS